MWRCGRGSWSQQFIVYFCIEYFFFFFCGCRWEKYQIEEEATLGRGKRQRKAVSYREAYAPHPAETPSEVIKKVIARVWLKSLPPLHFITVHICFHTVVHSNIVKFIYSALLNV